MAAYVHSSRVDELALAKASIPAKQGDHGNAHTHMYLCILTKLFGSQQILRWCDRTFGGFDALQISVDRHYPTVPPPSPERVAPLPAYLVPAPPSSGQRCQFQPLFSPLPPGSPPLEDSDDEESNANLQLWAPLW
ncbi:hypothetical protein PM082_023635 [Marasmius tenuissimus]|nr:hypothetical protein PM082_023635 [Marasmius tenuissimus]